MFALLIQYTIIYATVLALVAFGGMFSERSGVMNIGLEGIMVIGALAGAIALAYFGETMSGFFLILIVTLISMIAGLLYSMLLAVATINFKADQTITGTALNILSVSFAVLVARAFNKATSPEIRYNKSDFVFRIFANSEGVGGVQLSSMTIMCAIFAVLAFYFLFKTKNGRHLMACGEHPQAADSLGINVYKMRYIGVALSGLLAGLGGIAYIFPSVSIWDFTNGVAGFGFLALAVMIFGQWKPFKIVFAAILFGFFRSLSFIYSGIPFLESMGIPGFIYRILPYLVSVIVLAFTSKKSKGPKAVGIPYDKGKR